MKLNVIKHAHDKGHFGDKLCEELLNEECFTPNMSIKTDKTAENFVICILCNLKHGK